MGDAANTAASPFHALSPQDGSQPVDLAGDPARTLAISRRIHEKIESFDDYNFTSQQKKALHIFFDLAQEFPEAADLYTVTVAVPKLLFNLDCALYLLDAQRRLRVVRRSGEASPEVEDRLAAAIPAEAVVSGGHLLIPIKGNRELVGQLPFPPEGDVIGCLDVHPAGDLAFPERFFFQKYANRVGFQIHNRIIAIKNREHIAFIQSLVHDIGHNVIVPNMYFKLFLNRLKGKIQELVQFRDELDRRADQVRDRIGPLAGLAETVTYLHDGLMAQYGEISRHYEQTSLFLETLLRRSHFEQGRYVLQKRACNLRRQVIDPQLERFRPRLEERGVDIDMSLGGVPDESLCMVADIGLLAQVYANLFSNAAKYARQAPGSDRPPFVAFGAAILPGHFGPRADGIKLNVFSSGPRLNPADVPGLYEPGFRGANVAEEYGTGRGLFFVRQVVELHGGVVGYHATAEGNDFYFILPLVDEDGPRDCRAMGLAGPEPTDSGPERPPLA
jgi:signal transduction histidine kinase